MNPSGDVKLERKNTDERLVVSERELIVLSNLSSAPCRGHCTMLTANSYTVIVIENGRYGVCNRWSLLGIEVEGG